MRADEHKQKVQGGKDSMTTHNPYRWLMLFGVWLLYFSFGLAVTSIAPLVEPIRADLNLSYTEIGVILGVWQFVYIGSAIPCGMLLDKLGAKNALMIGGAIIATSILARAYADSFIMMTLAVMLFGLGGPIVSAGAPKLVTGMFQGSERGLAMGIYMTGPGVGGIISLTLTHPVLLPNLGDDWRNIMILWGLVTGACTLIWIFISRLGKSAPDHQAESVQGSQLKIIRQLIRDPAVLIVMFMSIGVFFMNHGLSNWLPELLRSTGLSQTEAGFLAAIPTVIGIAGSLLIPRLATPQRRFNILIGLCLAALAASCLLQFSRPELLYTGLFLQGAARSALMTILILTLVELPSIGERYAGVASGFLFSAAEVGGVVGPIAMGVLYDWNQNFVTALVAVSAVALLTTLGAVRLKSLAKATPATAR